ncbi:MAG: 16S rRNA (cytosine(1402)-N(4))-methyltransferase RsmH [Parvularculaceae bacterium]
MDAPHVPVLLAPVLERLAPRDGDVVVDGTFGAGGYASALLQAADCRVIGFDRDPAAVSAARGLVARFAPRLQMASRPFAQMAEGLADLGLDAVDGVVLDLGVSSMQLDDGARGFSYRRDGPLSMRMDDGRPNAADVVAAADVSDLAEIFRVYGEERAAGRLARAVVAAREAAPIETTGALAQILEDATPMAARDKIHPATRAFQALRIFVNDELGQLAAGLDAAEGLLRPEGRLVVVTFHSLEDRIVKRFFSDRTGRAGGPSRHAPVVDGPPPSFVDLTRKPVAADAEEIARNPRARSAKLRAARRADTPAIDAPARPPNLRLSKPFEDWRRAWR